MQRVTAVGVARSRGIDEDRTTTELIDQLGECPRLIQELSLVSRR
mgnify:CR=1 FL=1